MNCNLDKLKILGKGQWGEVYNNNNSVIKKIIITKNNIKNIKWEIKIMNKISNEPFFPTIYNAKFCNTFVLIKMEKLDYNMNYWMTLPHSINEWKSIYKQLFIILNTLYSKYKIINLDVKPDNIMFKNNRLYMIDFGITRPYSIGNDHIGYQNMINLYCGKYGINIFTISEELIKLGYSKSSAWNIANNYNKSQKLFDDKILNINNIKKWSYPDEIIPFIKKLQSDFGETPLFYLKKYFNYNSTS